MTAPENEAAEVRPPTVNITSHATEIKAGHVWTGDQGTIHGALELNGQTWITVHSPEQAREIVTAAAELAIAMETHAAVQDGAS